MQTHQKAMFHIRMPAFQRSIWLVAISLQNLVVPQPTNGPIWHSLQAVIMVLCDLTFLNTGRRRTRMSESIRNCLQDSIISNLWRKAGQLTATTTEEWNSYVQDVNLASGFSWSLLWSLWNSYGSAVTILWSFNESSRSHWPQKL